MDKKTFLLIILILITCFSFGNANAIIKLNYGLSFSKIFDDDEVLDSGINYGISISSPFISSTKISFGVQYYNVKFKLNDKVYLIDTGQQTELGHRVTLEYFNKNVSIHYIDIPLMIEKDIFDFNQIKICLRAGPSLTIPFKDETKTFRYKDSKEVYLNDNPEYDYLFEDSDGIDKIGFSFHTGMNIQYKRIGIGVNLIIPNFEFNYIKYFSLNKKIYVMNLAVEYFLN